MNTQRIIQIISALLICFKGYAYKLCVDMRLLKIPNLNCKRNDDYIISLTSYGRRVKKEVVYYTLISLLRQKIKPDRIVLWLDENEWNDITLPHRIKALRNKGIDILYCEDLKSYKKLIPSLLKYPNSSIITVDDDCIYPIDLVEQLVHEHEKNQSEIICLYASMPLIKDGIPFNYHLWKDLTSCSRGHLIFPTGAAGILYPPNSLHKDVVKKELFQKLAPLADDLWFWFCGLYNNTEKIFVPRKHEALSFDMFYQYTHKGSALTHVNKHLNKNDEQLSNIFCYYNTFINEKGLLSRKTK